MWERIWNVGAEKDVETQFTRILAKKTTWFFYFLGLSSKYIKKRHYPNCLKRRLFRNSIQGGQADVKGRKKSTKSEVSENRQNTVQFTPRGWKIELLTYFALTNSLALYEPTRCRLREHWQAQTSGFGFSTRLRLLIMAFSFVFGVTIYNRISADFHFEAIWTIYFSKLFWR
jgi:hypothetical protein